MTTLPRPQRPRLMVLLLVSLGLVALLRTLSYYADQWHRRLTYSEFYAMVESNQTTKQIAEARLVEDRILGQVSDGRSFYVYVPRPDERLLQLLRTQLPVFDVQPSQTPLMAMIGALFWPRSEEHTSELQSQFHLVCRLLL